MVQWTSQCVIAITSRCVIAITSQCVIAIVVFQVWRFPQVSGHAVASPHSSPRQHHQRDDGGVEHLTGHGSVPHEPASGAKEPEDGEETGWPSPVREEPHLLYCTGSR